MINNSIKPLVSVAIATYNGAKYIHEQLDSIISQTYTKLEIIIIDDGSTDGTQQIIAKYQAKYQGLIKLHHNISNLGSIKSFELALKLCSGDYIALSDQDDIWFPNKIEELLNNIHDNLLIHSDAIIVDENMNVKYPSHFKLSKDKSLNTFSDYLLQNNVTGCTAMLSRKLLQLSLPFPEQIFAHDHYLAIIASFYGKIKLLDKPLVYYRQHSNNLIGAKYPDFDTFISQSKDKSDSYAALLTLEIFKYNHDIMLLRDYRLSIYLGRWQSKFSIFRILNLKHGYKLLIFYIMIIKHGILARAFYKVKQFRK